MFQGICGDILDAKWLAVSELDFPINAKKISAADCLNADLRQFFFAEINHYSRQVLQSLTINTNISPELSCNSDGDAVTNILYDWVEFSNEEAYNLLKSAIDTEIFFLISPARCLVNFLFSSIDESTNENEERAINDIIRELEFINDQQEIINTLKDELEELSNVQKDIARNKLANIVNDVTFNLYQKQSIEEFLLPCQHYLEFSANEDIPVAFVELFLQERDLAGVLTEIRNFAIANEKQTLSYEELYNKIGKLTGKLPEDTGENVLEIEENLPITEEDIPVDLDLTEKPNVEDLSEPEVIEEIVEEELPISDEISENEEPNDILEEIVELSEGEIVEEIEDIENDTIITEDNTESIGFEDSFDVTEEVQMEDDTVEAPEEEITEELEDNSNINEDIVDTESEEFETAEEPTEDMPTNDFVEEIGVEEIADTAIEEEHGAIDEEEVAETEDNVNYEFEETETPVAEEPATEEDIANETAGEVIVPEDFEEFAEAVEQEVDNTIAELDKEDPTTEPVINETPKPAPVVVPPTPAMQEVMANSSHISNKMAEMRSNYINSKVAEMRALGKTLFEIEHNYLEMETEYVTKILNLLKE